MAGGHSGVVVVGILEIRQELDCRPALWIVFRPQDDHSKAPSVFASALGNALLSQEDSRVAEFMQCMDAHLTGPRRVREGIDGKFELRHRRLVILFGHGLFARRDVLARLGDALLAPGDLSFSDSLRGHRDGTLGRHGTGVKPRRRCDNKERNDDEK